jgi:outer membrane protein OmpA-like peptidoglycan-associated protein
LAAPPAIGRTLPLPAYAVLPPEVPPPGPDQLTYEAYGEAEFFPNVSAPDDAQVRQGKHWHADLQMKGMPDDVTGPALLARLKPVFTRSGWTILAEYGRSATFRLQKPGLDAWANLSTFGADDIRLDVVEIGPPTLTLALTVPAATPEKIVPERGDFPYITPLPGSKFESGQQDNAPLEVTPEGADTAEIVGTGTIVKTYAAPDGLSKLAFATAYLNALTVAGWNVVNHSQGMHQTDAAITAHFAKNGRDIWAYLHGTPSEYSIRVTDAGARDLGGELARNCHVALYGVLFDFNKATLKPESDSVLTRALAILEKDSAAKVEVQGHTDGVGGDAYNMTLSDARARSVVVWLTQHGVAAERMTAKGYGKTMPVADNDSDEGRAKNRRVEMARIGCRAK